MGSALVVLAALAGLVLLLLAVPVGVGFHLQGIEPLEGQVAIRWLFGLVRYRLRVPARSGRRPAAGPGPDAAEGRAKPRERRPRPGVLGVLRQAAFRRRAWRLVEDVFRAAHLRELRLRLRLGLGDPADTGRLWALVGPVVAATRLRDADVRIEPEFGEPVLEFEARGRLLLVPLKLLGLAVAFALSPPSIRAWRALRAARA